MSNTDATPETGLTVTFNPLVIAFIVIGAFLFITLIILVFVLIFCLRRKSKPRDSKTRPRRLTDVESVGESQGLALLHDLQCVYLSGIQ